LYIGRVYIGITVGLAARLFIGLSVDGMASIIGVTEALRVVLVVLVV